MVGIPSIPPQARAMRIFTSVTGGVGLLALIGGFSVCLFDLSQVDACADYAVWAFDVFKAFGDHVVAWAIALFEAIQSRAVNAFSLQLLISSGTL